MVKVFVTGERGFIGSYLTRRLSKLNFGWRGFDLRYGKDIRNKYQVYEAFDLYRPDVVIHLAALAGVRRGEEFPEEYIFSSYMYYAYGKENELLHEDPFYADFGKTPQERQASYRELMTSESVVGKMTFCNSMRSKEL